MKKEPCVRISDYDGTLTTEKSADSQSFWLEDLSRRIAMPMRDLKPRYETAEAIVRRNPPDLGWMINNRIVAPANSGAFIRANVTTRLVLTEMLAEKGHPKNLDVLNIDTLLDSLYHASRPLAKFQFREGAKEFIREQHSIGKFFIVTNSSGDIVTRELDAFLGDDHGVQVIGNARKFAVRRDRPIMYFPGVSRPIYLDRPFYKRVIIDIVGRSKRGVTMGDVAELDHLVALGRGLGGILLQSEDTPKWEVEYMRNHPKGVVVSSLPEASEYIRSLW